MNNENKKTKDDPLENVFGKNPRHAGEGSKLTDCLRSSKLHRVTIAVSPRLSAINGWVSLL